MIWLLLGLKLSLILAKAHSSEQKNVHRIFRVEKEREGDRERGEREWERGEEGERGSGEGEREKKGGKGREGKSAWMHAGRAGGILRTRATNRRERPANYLSHVSPPAPAGLRPGACGRAHARPDSSVGGPGSPCVAGCVTNTNSVTCVHQDPSHFALGVCGPRCPAPVPP